MKCTGGKTQCLSYPGKASRPGAAMSCNTCKAYGPDCTGVPANCTNGEITCAKVIEHNIIFGHKITTVQKGCLKNNITCGEYHGFDESYNFWIELYTECCNGDNCNHGTIEMPERNMTANGLQCASCFAQDSLHCEKKPMKCTGNKNECMSYSGPASRPGQEKRNYAFFGCATPDACKISKTHLIGSAAHNRFGLSCKNATKIGDAVTVK